MDKSRSRSKSADPRSKVKAEPGNGESSRVVKTERNVSVTEVKRESEFGEDDKRRVKVVRTKKEAEDDADDKKVVSSVKSKKKVLEDDKKSIVSVSTKKTVVVKEKERKTFDLPGQRHEPPEERDGLRIFYESLYRQRPESEIAQIWMMEHGMLEHDEAKQILDRVRQKKLQFGGSSKSNGTPTKGVAASNGQASRKSVTPARRAPETKKISDKTPEVKKGKKSPDTNGKASDGKKTTKTSEKSKGTKRKEYDSEEDTYSEEEVIPTRKRRG